MFPKTTYFSDQRAIAYCVAVLVALTFFKFGLYLAGMGLLFGIGISVQWRIANDGDDVPLWLALLMIVGGAAAWLFIVALADGYGVEPLSLSREMELSRFVRRMPFLAVLLMVAGSFLALANLCGRPGAGKEPGP